MENCYNVKNYNFLLNIQLYLFILSLTVAVFNCMSTPVLLDYTIPKERIVFNSLLPELFYRYLEEPGRKDHFKTHLCALINSRQILLLTYYDISLFKYPPPY